MNKGMIEFGLLVLVFALLFGACASHRPEPASEDEYVCVMERGSDIFHRRQCIYARKIESADKVFFHSYDDAISAGYKPCELCNPVDEDESVETTRPDSSEK